MIRTAKTQQKTKTKKTSQYFIFQIKSKKKKNLPPNAIAPFISPSTYIRGVIL